MRAGADVLRQVRCRALDVVPFLVPRLGDREQHLLERGQPVPRLRREVGASEEGLAGGRQEDGHRPATLAGQRDDRVHVDRVEIGPLLAIDLDADEALVQHARGERILERLVLHHMAPVAGRVADREQDRPVLVPCPRERLLAPRVPVDGVARMLQEIRRGFLGEAVHTRSVGLQPGRRPTTPASGGSASTSTSRTTRSAFHERCEAGRHGRVRGGRTGQSGQVQGRALASKTTRERHSLQDSLRQPRIATEALEPRWSRGRYCGR